MSLFMQDDRGTKKITAFYDLEVWKAGHELVLLTYRITGQFPKEELFGLTSQMRRAVVSITSNIAEGFGRRSTGEKLQFYNTSKGSLTELHNQLMIAKDIGYLSLDLFNEAETLLIRVHTILNAFISSTHRFVGHN